MSFNSAPNPEWSYYFFHFPNQGSENVCDLPKVTQFKSSTHVFDWKEDVTSKHVHRKNARVTM